PFFDGTVNMFDFQGNSVYNAGQVSLRKRGGGGTFYRLNYSYSKSIDEASQLNLATAGGLPPAAWDPTNRRLDRRRSDWDRGRGVSGAFCWQVAVGRGKKLLGAARGWEQGIVGGWQFSGTSYFATGAPLSISTSGANANLGESLKPNRIAKGIPDEIPSERRG